MVEFALCVPPFLPCHYAIGISGGARRAGICDAGSAAASSRSNRHADYRRERCAGAALGRSRPVCYRQCSVRSGGRAHDIASSFVEMPFPEGRLSRPPPAVVTEELLLAVEKPPVLKAFTRVVVARRSHYSEIRVCYRVRRRRADLSEVRPACPSRALDRKPAFVRTVIRPGQVHSISGYPGRG